MITRFIVTGMHQSGKSTILRQLINKKKNMSYVRLEIGKLLKRLGSFSFDSYLNYFQLYDRFLPIELFASWGYPNVTIVRKFFELIKPWFNDTDVICFFFHEFRKTNKNTSLLRKNYEYIYSIMSDLGYNVKYISSKQDIKKLKKYVLQEEFKQSNPKKFPDYIRAKTFQEQHELEYNFLDYWSFMSKDFLYDNLKKFFEPFHIKETSDVQKHNQLVISNKYRNQIRFTLQIAVRYDDKDTVLNNIPNQFLQFRSICFAIYNSPSKLDEYYQDFGNYGIWYTKKQDLHDNDNVILARIHYDKSVPVERLWETVYKVMFYRSKNNVLKTEYTQF